MSPLGRSAAILTLLLAACGSPEADEQNRAIPDASASVAAAEATTANATYATGARDRFCLAGSRAGLIVYGNGDANCTVSGTAERSGSRLTIIPAGDTTCRIQATLEGDSLTLGEVSQSCAYYCGPTASFAGKSFARTPAPQPVTDVAGDPLC